AGPGEGRPVEPGAVRAAGHDLQLDEALPPVPDDRGPDDRPLGTVTDQGGVGGDPVTAQGRDVARRLDEVGLALAVAAQEGGDPRGEGQLGGAVAAEV